MERLSLRRASGEMLVTMWNAQKRFMPASTFKVPHAPVSRSMPERSVTQFQDSVGWRNGL